MNLEKAALVFKRIRLVHLALICILVNVIVFVFLGLPSREGIFRLQSDHADLQSRVLMQEREISDLKKRLAALQQAQNDLQVMYTKVLSPKKTGVTGLRLELEDLTQSLQVRRQEVSYGYSPLPQFGLLRFTLGVPVAGSYRNIRRFINAIERSEHFLILDRVDLSAEQMGEQLNLGFQLSTYLRDEKKKEGT